MNSTNARIISNGLINMVTNKELEKRIDTLEKEVQHIKAVLQYQMRNKKKWFILKCIAITSGYIKHISLVVLGTKFQISILKITPN